MSRTYLRQQLLNGKPDDNADVSSIQNSTCLFPNSRVITNLSSPGNPYLSSSQQPFQNYQSSYSVHDSASLTKNKLEPLSDLALSQQISSMNMFMMPASSIDNQHESVSSGCNTTSSSSIASEYLRMMNQPTGISNDNIRRIASMKNQDILQDISMTPQCTFERNLQTFDANISALLPNSNYFSDSQQLDQNQFYLQNNTEIYNQSQFLPDESQTNQGILKNLKQPQQNMFDLQQQQQQQNPFIASFKDEPVDMMNINSSGSMLHSQKEVSFAGSLPNPNDIWDVAPRRFDHQIRQDLSSGGRHGALSAPSLAHIHMKNQLSNFLAQSQDIFQQQDTMGSCDSGFFMSSANAYGSLSSQLNTPKSMKSFDFSIYNDDDENKTAMKKAFHNVVERRRRDLINDCLSVLNDIVPIPNASTNNDYSSSFDELSCFSSNKMSLNSPAPSSSNNPEAFFNFSNPRTSPNGLVNVKRNKGTILKDTINYIKTFHKQMSDLKQINEQLRDMLKKTNATASEKIHRSEKSKNNYNDNKRT